MARHDMRDTLDGDPRYPSYPRVITTHNRTTYHIHASICLDTLTTRYVIDAAATIIPSLPYLSFVLAVANQQRIVRVVYQQGEQGKDWA